MGNGVADSVPPGTSLRLSGEPKVKDGTRIKVMAKNNFILLLVAVRKGRKREKQKREKNDREM